MARGHRFLVVVPPMTGHMNPTIAVGDELAARGHTVAWTGHPEVVEELVPASGTFIPVAGSIPTGVVETYTRLLSQNIRGARALRDIIEGVVLPLCREMVPGVQAAVDAFGPDALLVDSQAFAGAAVAELRGLPWATSCTTSMELNDPLAALPKVMAWFRQGVTEALVEAGLDRERAATLDPRLSPHLILAFTTAELVGPPEDLPPGCALVGPSLEGRAGDTPFPWDWFEQPGPHVLVSLGTVNWMGGARFFPAAAEAIAGMNARAVMVAPPDAVPDPPPNVLVRPQVPQLALMPHLDAVVSHGGHNTVCESLAFGRPLVVAPVRDDQPFVAEQVRRAGAGVRVSFNRATARSLRDALSTVLSDPDYRKAAARVQASFAAAGGPPEAADRLETLATGAATLPTAKEG